MKRLKHQDLMSLYKEGTDADSVIYSEQRSNLMMVAGNHYAKKNSRFWSRVRDNKEMSQDQKIRLVKNHVQRICKIYENNILTLCPTVAVSPKNGSELQDQKSAELHQSVWTDIKKRHNFDDRVREFVQDFVRIGESAVKIYWDDMKGEFKGYSQKVDPLGQPEVDEMGQPIADKEKPIFSGDIVFERIFGFNLFRAREAKSMDESWFIGLRKMVDVEELKARIGDDEEKLKMVQVSADETYLIFDGQNTSYGSQDHQCLLLEMYIKPNACYPKGYYFVYTNQGVLWEGELPMGVFPIIYSGFDEVPTNPRHHSIIKVIRPYQAELNRASSKIAEAQITLGDDKLLIQAGSKIAQGGTLAGVRAVTYAGAMPTVLPGRSGDQYLGYMQQQIQEMYQVANLQEDLEVKQVQTDPNTQLYLSMEQKKKYVVYSNKVQKFLSKICEVALDINRLYIQEDALIACIGRSEYVNITEYKNSSPLNYQISLDPAVEDQETRYGKQIFFNTIMQYVGSKLDPKDIGKLVRISPYANNEEAFSDLTMDYDNGTNIILSLDRGKPITPNPKDDPAYMIKRISNRMRKADFEFLSDEVKASYQQIYDMYVQIEADEKQKIQEAALGFIPMSGMAVVCDLYVPDPNNSSKTMRARVPYDSLTWLLKRLEEQGASQAGLMEQQQGVIADIAERLVKQRPQPQQQMAAQTEQSVQPSITPQIAGQAQ